MKNKLNTIDLFAGCGGLMDGFQQEGHYETLACVEWEKAPCNTLINRLRTRWHHDNADEEVIRFDIQRTEELFSGFEDDEYGNHEGLDKLIGKKKIDVIIGGPPCQAYSLAGRIRDEHGMRDDYRNYLFESYIRVVNHFCPKYFIFENVIGMLSAMPDGTPIVNKIKTAFDEAGYYVINDFSEALFDVADFGIPQHRRRVIILGVRKDSFEDDSYKSFVEHFYRVELPKNRTTYKTVQEAIGDLPKIYPAKEVIKLDGRKYSHTPTSFSTVQNHEPRYHCDRDIKTFNMLADDIQSGRNQFTDTDSLKRLYTTLTGKESNIHKYYVLRSNEPSNTIPAHLNKDGLRHIHPDPKQARSITVREAARLQAFDDDFVFLGPQMLQYKMVGNAVPPQFARIVADSLYKTIRYYDK